MDKDIKSFKETLRLAQAYGHALGVMNYDGMTAAPRNSAAGRARTCALLSGRLHELTGGRDFLLLLERLLARGEELDALTYQEVKYLHKSAVKAARVPPEAFARHSGIIGEASAAWREAKRRNDFAVFAPHLKRVFESAAETARLAEPEKEPYDHWLDEYEEGASQSALEGFFGGLKTEIVPLIARVLKRSRPETSFLHGRFPVREQRAFTAELMEIMGIDRDSCTVAEVEHPYTTALSNRDVRITTHYFEDFVTANMFSVLHEGGHAIYEMGVSDELAGSPLSGPASAGVHESQSRFYENVIGRSYAFSKLILPVLQRHFPDRLGGVTPREFFLAVNAVEPTLKRTEADELTYPLHVLIRYELEKRIMRGELEAERVPAEWNRLYGEYLGIEPPDDARGCLQDMHWGSGLIGYFPTYALGNAYGAQISCAMRRELEVDRLVEGGDIPAVTYWLRGHIHRFGRTKTPAELIELAAGAAFDPGYYLAYLKEKYTRIYGI